MVSSATEGVRTNKVQIANRSRSLTKENMENILENDTEMKYDRDSVITVISREVLKENVDSATNYSNSDLESEMDLPVAFNADEDDNARRKSDIVINESNVEKQPNTSTSHFSKLFNQFYKASNPSKPDSKESNNDKVNMGKNDDKTEFKSINGLLVQTEQITKSNRSIDSSGAQEKSVPAENPIETLEDEDASDVEKEIPILDQILDNSQEADLKDETEMKISLDDTSHQEKGTEEWKNGKNYKTSNKTNNGNAGMSNLEQDPKTVNENSKQFDKAKLLAAMKAIDDNENIEFVDQKTRRNSGANRLQITQNLYRGIPTHSKKKNDIMKELFADTKIDNKSSN